MRLARYFDTSASFWISFRAHYGVESSRSEIEERIEREVRPRM